MRNAILSLAVGSALLFGPAGAQENESAESVQRTVVWVDEDGQLVVTTSRITVEEQREEIAARQRMIELGDPGNDRSSAPAGSATVDPGCAGASLWLFDQSGLTGNEICFQHYGYATLTDYIRTQICSPRGCFRTTWGHAIRSYWAGVSPGCFMDWDGDYGTYCFQPWERADNANPTAQNVNVIWLSL